MRGFARVFILTGCLLVAGKALPLATTQPVLAAFSDMQPGATIVGWQQMELRGRSPAQYKLIAENNETVLQVTAEQSASALVHPLAPPASAPGKLEWRWKIGAHIEASDITLKSGDDFPARVYVTFARDRKELSLAARARMRLAKLLYNQDVPAAALCYVWARDLPVGTMVPNAYSDTVVMVVVRSGGATPSGWQTEQRDLSADYEAAFGSTAPPATSVIVAADTDDTGATVRSWFGDITLKPAK
ncbi:MAG: DUF3047 domain-containing protein [Gammaproteobacteria bacterium]|nr:DUF3047 domain-containing protein [Gammaproteobacteria bacterium]